MYNCAMVRNIEYALVGDGKLDEGVLRDTRLKYYTLQRLARVLQDESYDPERYIFLKDGGWLRRKDVKSGGKTYHYWEYHTLDENGSRTTSLVRDLDFFLAERGGWFYVTEKKKG